MRYPGRVELRHIRYFLAVAEERSFTRAAARVGIGQSPLSQQIRDLEREVGASLFHRVAYGAELTAAGHAFLDSVRVVPAAAERALVSARRAARGESGRLALGFTASAAFNPAVPGAIRAFRRGFPDVLLSLEEANTTRLVAGLREGSLDAVFLRSDPSAIGADDVQLRLVSEEPMLLVLPASHPAAAEDAVPLTAVAGEALLVTPREAGPTLFDTVVQAFRDAGVEPRMQEAAPQLPSLVNLVAAALGIALVPASLARIAVDGVAFRPVAGVLPVTRLSLATRRGDTAPVVRNFIARLRPDTGTAEAQDGDRF
jgi:DNA-binding transcriptional LysR family regulator